MVAGTSLVIITHIVSLKNNQLRAGSLVSEPLAGGFLDAEQKANASISQQSLPINVLTCILPVWALISTVRSMANDCETVNMPYGFTTEASNGEKGILLASVMNKLPGRFGARGR
jgi:hypothetical protein